ncbi:MAG: methyl-accepting chemotaxis protein [Syntrophobacteraceae bacterium]
MKRFQMGIGGKIFGGFIALIVIAMIIGAAGFVSLSRSVDLGHLNGSARDVDSKLLEARNFEKDFMLKKNEESYKKLLQSINELETLTAGLKGEMADSRKADEIVQALQVYKKSAEELKRLEDEDAAILANLQEIGAGIASRARIDSNKVSSKVSRSFLDSSAESLKANANKQVRSVVEVGYDILKHYHEKQLPQEDALDAIRHLHFDGNNYFFVVKENLTLAAHGNNPEMEGQDFSKIEDKKTGVTFMMQVVGDAVMAGESTTEYYWTKPGKGDEIFPKIAFAKYFKPWRLVVCAGVYVDDIQAELAKTEVLLKEGLENYSQSLGINTASLEARLAAVNYFLYGRNPEGVGEALKSISQAQNISDKLKNFASEYLEKFTMRVKNSETRQKSMARIEEAQAGTLKAAKEVAVGATDGYTSGASSSKKIILAFILFGAVVGLTFAVLLLRTITRPIIRAIQGIREASDQVSAAAEHISYASSQLAEGASEQASAIEETSSSLEEMAAMTRQNAENAGHANQLMSQSRMIADKANESMTHLTASMGEISGASEETQKIIKTIDEIAFQTNLLALNAAVEAARAGEAGAGFAVVADEVRNLAMRAAEAARNTARLIEGTVKKVQEGSALVERTNREFNEVAVSVAKSGELVSEIAAASQEQSQGIGQVNKAISEMDKVVQGNAANAEESASASTQMNAQATHLQTYIEDLASLVGGRASQGGGNMKELAGPAEEEPALPPPASRPKRISGWNGDKPEKAVAPRRPANKEVGPEQIIPLDE